MLSAALLALGVIMLLDLAGTQVATSFYFSVPLAILGAGLVVGAWRGRARMLIALGIVLSICLAVTASIENRSPNDAGRSVTWQPASIAQLGNPYEIGMGNATLDLSAVDFAGSSTSVDVHVSVGNLDVVVPPDVDVTVQAKVDVGNAIVFGEQWGGINQPERAIVDDGADGSGGGELSVRATVDVGDLEVRR
ncbi:MAG TPA: LiaF domain-containing protein [Pilimelia sp.]|nr:LiaF domain-containing protein [Pilimelia sp.]